MTGSSVEQKVERDELAIPESEWRWRGMPGHLIVADQCCFHMVTEVGDYKISSIGCYHHQGDPRNYDTRQPIGAGEDSLYETFVFRLHHWSEIDGERWATEEAAEAGHMAYCRKYAAADPEAVSD